MKTFLQLNRHKLTSIFGRLSLILLGAVSLILFLAYLIGNFPNIQLLISIILVTAIGSPLFIMFLGYIIWNVNHRARQKAFSKVPISDIENIGFYKAYLGDTSKWSFTDEIKMGHINGFTLTMDVSKEKGHTLEFDIQTEWKKVDKSDFSRLTEMFKQHNIEFRIGSLTKLYDTRSSRCLTVTELKQDLEFATTILLKEGFTPRT